MARDFNGTTNRIDWSAVTNLTGDPVSISAWVYSDGVAGNVDWVFTIHPSGDAGTGLIIWMPANDNIAFYRTGSTSLYVIGRENPSVDYSGAWHHILITHDGVITTASSVHIYIDGAEADVYSTQVNGASETAITGSWSIGGRIYDDNRNFDGKIGELAVWSAVVDGTTITGLAAGNSPDFYTTNLVFYWKGKADSLVASPGGTGTNDGSTDYTTSFPAIKYPSTNTGAITPAGTIINSARKILSGALTSAGTLINSARKVLAGALTSAGDLIADFIGGGGEEYEQAVAGELTSSGALVNSTRKILSGALTSAGALVNSARKVLSGAITPTTNGVFSKEGIISLAGAVTSAGTLVNSARKILSGALTSAGVLANSARKVLAGELISSGALLNQAKKVLDGALTSSGTLINSARKVLDGALTSSGALASQIGKLLGGALTSSSELVKMAVKPLSGSLTSSGALVNSARKILDGALTSAGEIIKHTTKTMAGELTPAGILTTIKAAIIALGGTLTSAGELTRKTSKALAGSLTSMGDLIRSTLKALAGSLASSGVVSAIKSGAATYYQVVSGALSFTGTLTNQVGRIIAAALARVRAIIRGISGIRAAPDGVPDSSAVYPFSVAWLGPSTVQRMDASTVDGNWSIIGQVHFDRKELFRAEQYAAPFARLIAIALLSDPTLNKKISYFDRVTISRLQPLVWGETPTIGFEFVIDGIHIREDNPA